MSGNKISIGFLKQNFHFILSTIIIWCLGLLFIGDNTTIKIIGDEFGYWTAAAWLTGKDWSDVAALNSYYGYGYGILLSFILSLPLNPLMEYKLAIILNILMLNAVYFIIYYLVNALHLFEKKYISSLIALTTTLYAGNTFHAQFTMTETILLLAFWLFILLLYSLDKKYAFYKILLGALLIVYLYILHHRMLGVILIGLICLLSIQMKRRKYHSAILFLILTVGLMLGSEYIKKFYQDTYLVSEYTNMLHYNDYSGQISSARYAFSWDGIRLLFIGIIGKIFYVLSSTYLLAGIAFFTILQKIYGYIKEKAILSKGIIDIFIFSSIAASITISSIYLLIYEARFDFLFYGRYSEFFISTLILIGLISLFKTERINIKGFFYLIIFYIIITAIVYMELPLKTVGDYSLTNAAGIYDTLAQYDQNIFIVGLKSVILNIIIILLTNLYKKNKQILFVVFACFILSFSWIATYTYNYGIGISSWAPYADQKEQALATLVEALNTENKIYYYAAEGRNIDFLQFLLEDIPIKCIYTTAQLADLPDDACLLTEHSTNLIETGDLQDYTQFMQSNRLILWKKAE